MRVPEGRWGLTACYVPAAVNLSREAGLPMLIPPAPVPALSVLASWCPSGSVSQSPDFTPNRASP